MFKAPKGNFDAIPSDIGSIFLTYNFRQTKFKDFLRTFEVQITAFKDLLCFPFHNLLAKTLN